MRVLTWPAISITLIQGTRVQLRVVTWQALPISPYAVATIVLYPIGIFALFATMLWSIRHSLDTPAAQSVLVGAGEIPPAAPDGAT